MGKAKQKNVPWLEIKADYLQRIPPRDLARKYNVSIKSISDRATKEKWTAEKTQMCANVRKCVEQEVKEASTEAVSYLRRVVNDENAETKDRISAAKGILDVSGMKSIKQELNGSLDVQKVYITPEEVKDTNNHIDKFIEG